MNTIVNNYPDEHNFYYHEGFVYKTSSVRDDYMTYISGITRNINKDNHYDTYIDFIKGSYIPLVKVKNVPIYIVSSNFHTITDEKCYVYSLVKEFEEIASNYPEIMLKDLIKEEKPYVDKNGASYNIIETIELFISDNYYVYIVGKLY